MELPIFHDETEEWSHMLLLYDAALKEINTKLEILNNEFKLAHQYNPIEHITSRIKSGDSIARKLRHQQHELNVENITKYVKDVAGIRIICSFTSDIYRIAKAIQNQNDITLIQVKDYIMNPKPNGYMSYHMIVTIPIFLSDRVIDTMVEIQIRTIAMDFWASLEHKIYYKFEGNAPSGIREELKECADIIAFLDRKMLSLNDYVKTYAQNESEGQEAENVVMTADYDSVVDKGQIEEPSEDNRVEESSVVDNADVNHVVVDNAKEDVVDAAEIIQLEEQQKPQYKQQTRPKKKFVFGGGKQV